MKYTVTRPCLSSGTIRLLRYLAPHFPSSGNVVFLDGEREVQAKIEGEVITGLGGFYTQYQVAVNDELIIEPLSQGRYQLQVRTRAKQAPRPTEPEPPVTRRREPATRAAPLKEKAEKAPPTKEIPPEALAATEPEAFAGSSRTDLLREAPALREWGFVVSEEGRGLLLSAEAGRRGYRAILWPLETVVNWPDLIELRRLTRCQYLGIYGPAKELAHLTEQAKLARASLWPMGAFARLKELAAKVPIGPLELREIFEEAGLTDAGLQAIESRTEEMLAHKGTFSGVIAALSQIKPGSIFLLEDLVNLQGERGATREAISRILDDLCGTPYFFLRRTNPGEYYLARPVLQLLHGLESYAKSLKEGLTQLS
ncbi:MAG: hypothetical protein HY335_09705 [Deinococcus sp.]|nr:hypothetical protein [Deinococcus sp.]